MCIRCLHRVPSFSKGGAGVVCNIIKKIDLLIHVIYEYYIFSKDRLLHCKRWHIRMQKMPFYNPRGHLLCDFFIYYNVGNIYFFYCVWFIRNSE